MQISIDIPKKSLLGEDAPPINIISDTKTATVVAVFDGLGGAGSTIYEEDGITHTGAYISSRTVREITNLFFLKKLNINDYSVEQIDLTNLKEEITNCFKDTLSKKKYEQSKLRSNLIKTLPTTLALGLVTKTTNSKFKIDVLWAGDSRIYILNPQEGLVQLTKDDLKLNNDPYENIENDSPLSNMVHLGDFIINHNIFFYNDPFIIIAATDGCFGYYSTPMHFENLLLSSMQKAENIDTWEKNITTELKNISGDDFSMSLVTINESSTENFESLKDSFKNRYKFLEENFMKKLIDSENNFNDYKQFESELKIVLSQLEKSKKDLFESLWKKYKQVNYPF